MRGEFPIGVVQHDLALARVLDHSGLEIVRHDPGGRTAPPFEHRHMAFKPGVLTHIQGGFDERVSRERETRDEEVDLAGVTGNRVGELHRGP